MDIKKNFKNMYVIIQERLVKYIVTFKVCMSKFLKLKNFKWIIVDEEKKEGYYSFKKNGFEIAIDWVTLTGWSVYLCNKFEEVLEEYDCSSKEEAIKIANKIYTSSVA